MSTLFLSGVPAYAGDDVIQVGGGIARQRVLKDAKKLALAQITVHYKTITTAQAHARSRTLLGKSADTASARVSAYLDCDLDDKDFQELTDRFHKILTERFAKVGIESVPFETAWKTDGLKALADYRKEENRKSEEKEDKVEGGQSWVSYNAYGGPVITRGGPGGAALFAAPNFKNWKYYDQASTDIDAPYLIGNFTVDFARIGFKLSRSESDTIYRHVVTKAGKVDVDDRVAVSGSMINVWMAPKAKGEWYMHNVPVVSKVDMKAQLSENADLPRLKTRKFFGATTFAFAPVQISPAKDAYKAAVISAMEAYADEFVEAVKKNNKL